MGDHVLLCFVRERASRIELPIDAWEASVLPLHYAREVKRNVHSTKILNRMYYRNVHSWLVWEADILPLNYSRIDETILAQNKESVKFIYQALMLTGCKLT